MAYSTQAKLLSGLPVIALLATPLQAQASLPVHFTDPVAIDRLVEVFTGQRIGSAGGASAPTDPRLRLRACEVPLQADWYGAPGRSVSVTCPDAHGWRIFVSLLALPHAPQASPAVRRGDSVTIAIKGRGFTVQRTGEAQASGAQGEWIAVRTERGGEPLRARIERPGLVAIPLQ